MPLEGGRMNGECNLKFWYSIGRFLEKTACTVLFSDKSGQRNFIVIPPPAMMPFFQNFQLF